MANRYANLCSFIKFKKRNDLCFSKVQVIIVKKTQKKFKNGDKKVKPKILNHFLVSDSIYSRLYKLQKIIYYYQDVTLASNLTEKKNKFKLVHFHHQLRFETKNELKICINSSRSI